MADVRGLASIVSISSLLDAPLEKLVFTTVQNDRVIL